MTSNDLKQLIQETIKTYITEKAPPGAKAERMVKHLKKSLADSHPEWNEKKVKNVAYATAWKKHGKTNEAKEEKDTLKSKIPTGELSRLNPSMMKKDGGKLQLPPKGKSSVIPKPKIGESGLTSEDNGECGDGGYDESDEVRLIRGLELITKKLSGMHKGMRGKKSEKEEVDEGGPQYKVVSPNATDTAKKDKAKQIQYDPKVTENHKVQHRSATTIKDVSQNSKNLRNPKVPNI
jgi:hypothetical protein